MYKSHMANISPISSATDKDSLTQTTPTYGPTAEKQQQQQAISKSSPIIDDPMAKQILAILKESTNGESKRSLAIKLEPDTKKRSVVSRKINQHLYALQDQGMVVLAYKIGSLPIWKIGEKKE
jgi:hypothetical protein